MTARVSYDLESDLAGAARKSDLNREYAEHQAIKARQRGEFYSAVAFENLARDLRELTYGVGGIGDRLAEGGYAFQDAGYLP